MTKHLWIAMALMLAAACTTNFKKTDEDGTLDGEDTDGTDLDTADGQDPLPDGVDVPPDGPDGTDAPDTPDGTGCPDGEIDCGGVCVNPREDRNNCGNCGIACEETEECVEGTCRCRMGLELCNEECVDLQADNEHCGWCNHPCPEFSECDNGDCVCISGLTMCDNMCVDTDTSNEHCGRCDHPCEEPLLCNGSGECSLECGSGFTVCPGPPAYCADLESDPMNCNACGHACPEPPDNARSVCEEGICWWWCLTGWYDANGVEADGCECHHTGAEVCDGADNDCNGAPDDTFDCVQYTSEPCALPSTDCSGQRPCTDDCSWGQCDSPSWVCLPGEVDNACHPPISDVCPGTRDCDNTCLGWSQCIETCEGSEPDCCPGGCTDMASDEANCGTCGRNCTSSTPYCCDSDCRQCCAGIHCQPNCRGTARPCSDFSNPTNCNDQSGCNWVTTGSCIGDPGGCSRYNGDPTGCEACGCVFSGPSTCSGTPSICGSFSDQGACEACSCAWMETVSCDGTARDCSSFFTEGGCTGQQGCEWYVCTDYTCQPG